MSVFSYVLTEKILFKIFSALIQEKTAQLYTILYKRNLIQQLALIIPIKIIDLSSHMFPVVEIYLQNISSALISLIIIIIIGSLLFALNDIYGSLNIIKRPSKKEHIHYSKLVIYTIGGIFIAINLSGISNRLTELLPSSGLFINVGILVCSIITIIIFTLKKIKPTQSSTVDLKDAAMSGNIEEMKQLIMQGSDVITRRNDGWVPLIWATENNHLDIVKLLIQKDVDIEAKDKNGWTALIMAAYTGSMKIIKFLLLKGSGINGKCSNGWTALVWAAHAGHADIVKYLIDKGSDINDLKNHKWKDIPDRVPILKFLLNLFSLQSGIEENSVKKFLPTKFIDAGPEYSYKLLIEHNDDVKSRIVSISLLGEGSGSKSKCYKVIYDNIWVIKIPPFSIKNYDEYIQSINAEHDIASHLAMSIECISPGVSNILIRTPSFSRFQNLAPDKLEKTAVQWLKKNPELQKYSN